MSINSVTITGNLTRDPELRTTGGGMSVMKLGVAVNDRRKDPRTGEWEDVANYVNVTVFGNRAEALANMLAKGSKVAVEGKLRWSSWQTPEGDKRSKIEVVADEIEFLSRPDAAPATGGHHNSPDPHEEIPF